MSKKQSVVATSSTEAECIAASESLESLRDSDAAIYSASVEEVATTDCFLLIHNTGAPFYFAVSYLSQFKAT
eukprot:275573-Prorocentrum_minimum.AAC.1